MYNLTHFRHMIKNKLLLSDHKSFKEPLTVGIGPVWGFLSVIFLINTKTICKFNNTTYNVLGKWWWNKQILPNQTIYICKILYNKFHKKISFTNCLVRQKNIFPFTKWKCRYKLNVWILQRFSTFKSTFSPSFYFFVNTSTTKIDKL